MCLVSKILCSSRDNVGNHSWKVVVREERRKTLRKRLDLAYRWLKIHKSKRPKMAPNLVECVTYVMDATSDLRTVPAVAESVRRKLASSCSDAISKTISVLNRLHQGSVPDHKLKSIAVGLLYLMRVGVSVMNVVALPAVPALRDLLPHENLLETMTGVKNKCITESENLCNQVLRSASMEELRKSMLADVACKM